VRGFYGIDDPAMAKERKVTFKEYVDQRFTDERRYNDQRFDEGKQGVDAALAAANKQNELVASAAEKAVNKEESQSQKWRENANEWRGAMTDRERDFLSRKEFYAIVATAITVITLLFYLKGR